jgi:hypothetical protein
MSSVQEPVALSAMNPNQAERMVIYALADVSSEDPLELPHQLGEVPRALAEDRVMCPSH